jgi:hypothetical protein
VKSPASKEKNAKGVAKAAAASKSKIQQFNEVDKFNNLNVNFPVQLL